MFAILSNNSVANLIPPAAYDCVEFTSFVHSRDPQKPDVQKELKKHAEIGELRSKSARFGPGKLEE